MLSSVNRWKDLGLRARKAGVFISAMLSMVVLMPGSIGATSVLELDKKIASVVPTAQEDAWLKIGWRTNLMQARAVAQKANRPLFLWVMNGHPMGCT